MFVPLWLPFALCLAFSGRHGGTAPTFYFRIFVKQSLIKNGVIVSFFCSPFFFISIFKVAFMAEYDTISKHLIQTYPDDFIRFTLGRADIEVLEVLETEQPTVEARRADSLILVRIEGEDALIHCEFQTADSTDTPMSHRMAGYIGRAIERYGLPIFSFVIYLRPGAGRRDKGYYIQELPGHEVLVKYKVIRLSEIDGQAIIEGGHPGLLPFAPLMKPPSGVSADAWLRQCLQATEALPLDASTKVDMMAGMAILGGISYELSTVRRIISQEGFMDAIMRESSFAQYLTQQGIDRGIEQGIEQGCVAAGRKGLEKAPLKIFSTCWRFALMRTRPVSSPVAFGPLTICNNSSSCFVRRCKWTISMLFSMRWTQRLRVPTKSVDMDL